MAAAKTTTRSIKERGADWDAAFGKALLRLGNRDLQHRMVVKGHCRASFSCWRGSVYQWHVEGTEYAFSTQLKQQIAF
jgi:hypothetical protein